MIPKSYSRFLLYHSLRNPRKLPIPQFPINFSTFPHFPTSQTNPFSRSSKTLFSTSAAASSRIINDLLADLEREKQQEINSRKRAGLPTDDIDEEDEEDYMGITPLIEKLEKEKLKPPGPDLYLYEEPSDSDSDDDDERFGWEAMEKKSEVFEKKIKRHTELLDNFFASCTIDESFKWMNKIDRFEERHLKPRVEYRVIGELMNRLKVAEGKEKFILQQKLNRAMRLADLKEAYDPNDPANYGVINRTQGPNIDLKEEDILKGDKDLLGSDDEDEFDDMKERDDILLGKLNVIDKKLEEKLAELDFTFGKKGKVLEEEIRDLAEERNSLTEKKRTPMYRKGFDVKLIDVNRTCKVTKGGQVVKYTAILACGNYNGVVGFAKAKGPAVPVALQKAYEKCFQNLHYVERHEEHTIAHAIQTNYKKTKVYLWPGSTRTGMKAGRIVQTVLNLAGFKNVKSKVIGSRNPHNTVKALFKALNDLETPKDVQEKFGRTVVEKVAFFPSSIWTSLCQVGRNADLVDS
ncbi:Ribosomal protein S5 family protein [Euphorbia peplus]|nr:Ribosomal protein S5 family protein [Euphorbia peplus]